MTDRDLEIFDDMLLYSDEADITEDIEWYIANVGRAVVFRRDTSQESLDKFKATIESPQFQALLKRLKTPKQRSVH